MPMAIPDASQPNNQPLQLEIQVKQLQENVETAIEKVGEVVDIFHSTIAVPSHFITGVKNLAPETAGHSNVLMHALSFVEASNWTERKRLFQSKFESFVENVLTPLVEECASQASDLQYGIESVREARSSFITCREQLDYLQDQKESGQSQMGTLSRRIEEVKSDLESHQEMMFHLLTSCNADANNLRLAYEQMILTCYTSTVRFCCDTMDAFSQAMRGSLVVASDELDKVVSRRQALETEDDDAMDDGDFNVQLAAFGVTMPMTKVSHSTSDQLEKGAAPSLWPESTVGSEETQATQQQVPQSTRMPNSNGGELISKKYFNEVQKASPPETIKESSAEQIFLDKGAENQTGKKERLQNSSVSNSPISSGKKKLSYGARDITEQNNDETNFETGDDVNSLAATPGGLGAGSPTYSEGNLSFVLDHEDAHTQGDLGPRRGGKYRGEKVPFSEKSIWDDDHETSSPGRSVSKLSRRHGTAPSPRHRGETSLHELLVATAGSHAPDLSVAIKSEGASRLLRTTSDPKAVTYNGANQTAAAHRTAIVDTPYQVEVEGSRSTVKSTGILNRHNEVDDVIKSSNPPNARRLHVDDSSVSSSECEDHQDFDHFSSDGEEMQVGHESDVTSVTHSPRSTSISSLLHGIQRSSLHSPSHSAKQSPNSLFNVFDENSFCELDLSSTGHMGDLVGKGSPLKTSPRFSLDELRHVSSKDQTFCSALGVRYATASKIGRRKSQEDGHRCFFSRFEEDNAEVSFGFFAVYDGHNGSDVSKELELRFHEQLLSSAYFPSDCRQALLDTCLKVDKHVLSTGLQGGSTACVALIFKKKLFIANVGDSEAILCSGGRVKILCKHLHKPSDPLERQRIEQAGGQVSNGRIFNMLGVARAFGDVDFKTSEGDFQESFSGDLVSSVPDIEVCPIDEKADFVVIGCDGLFDVMKHQDVADFVTTKLVDGHPVEVVSSALADEAIRRGSQDNVTTIVVCLNQIV